MASRFAKCTRWTRNLCTSLVLLSSRRTPMLWMVWGWFGISFLGVRRGVGGGKRRGRGVGRGAARPSQQTIPNHAKTIPPPLPTTAPQMLQVCLRFICFRSQIVRNRSRNTKVAHHESGPQACTVSFGMILGWFGMVMG